MTYPRGAHRSGGPTPRLSVEPLLDKINHRKRGMDVDDLAQRIGISVSRIEGLLTQETIRLDMAKRYVDALDLALTDVWPNPEEEIKTHRDRAVLSRASLALRDLAVMDKDSTSMNRAATVLADVVDRRLAALGGPVRDGVQ